MEDYPIVSYIPSVFTAAPAVITGCLRFPVIMRTQKETFTFKHTYNSISLSIWIFSFPSPTCNFVHTKPSILTERKIHSTTQLLCLHCEYQQATGTSAETCSSPSFADCYAGTVPVCFETKLMSSPFLCKMCMILTLGKPEQFERKKKDFLVWFSLVFSSSSPHCTILQPQDMTSLQNYSSVLVVCLDFSS